MKNYLQEIVNYVDEHVAHPITLDMISSYIGFSKYYLNHMFSIYTGFSIMEYVRKKKLEYALDLLKTDRRIIDIALEIGYSSERAFSRAVQKEYGHSPNYFRQSDVLRMRTLTIYDLTLNIDEDSLFSELPTTHKDLKNLIMERGVRDMKNYLSDIKYEVIEDMTVLSCTVEGNAPEDEVINLMNKLATVYGINPVRTFGFDSPVEGEQDAMQYRGYEYWLALSVDDVLKLPSKDTFQYEGHSIYIKHIPKLRYATLRISDPFSDPFTRITGGWMHLVKWLEMHDFKEPDFKRCNNANCLEEVKMIDGSIVMDIYIPIDKG